MNIRLVHTPVVILLCLLYVAPAPAQIDPQDDDAIAALINAEQEAKVRRDQLCIKRPRLVGGMVVVGLKTGEQDATCVVKHGVMGADLLPIHLAGQRLLEVKRWHEASPSMRAEMAKEWVHYGLLSFTDVLVKPDKPFEASGIAFHAPKGKTDGKGGAVVTAWVRVPAVPNAKTRTYQHLVVRFDENALGSEPVELEARSLQVLVESPDQATRE